MWHPQKLAFVLGGGGARGALQAGALRALFERGIHPDLLVGASAGAVNAAYLGLDPTREQVMRLEQNWRTVATMDLFPRDWAFLVARALLKRTRFVPDAHLREFFIQGYAITQRYLDELWRPRAMPLVDRLCGWWQARRRDAAAAT